MAAAATARGKAPRDGGRRGGPPGPAGPVLLAERTVFPFTAAQQQRLLEGEAVEDVARSEQEAKTRGPAPAPAAPAAAAAVGSGPGRPRSRPGAAATAGDGAGPLVIPADAHLEDLLEAITRRLYQTELLDLQATDGGRLPAAPGFAPTGPAADNDLWRASSARRGPLEMPAAVSMAYLARTSNVAEPTGVWPFAQRLRLQLPCWS